MTRVVASPRGRSGFIGVRVAHTRHPLRSCQLLLIKTYTSTQPRIRSGEVDDQDAFHRKPDSVCLCGHGRSLHAVHQEEGEVELAGPCRGCRVRLAAGDQGPWNCTEFREPAGESRCNVESGVEGMPTVDYS